MFKKNRIITLLAVIGLATVLGACSSQTKPYDAQQKLGSQINYTITGIDAGAGIMASTQKALSAYGLKIKSGSYKPVQRLR